MKDFHLSRSFGRKIGTVILCVLISSSLLPTTTPACTGLYAGSDTTSNGSAYVGRSEDFGPDYAKQFIIVPAADHTEGEMFEDDYGFSVPYPAHTLRYSAVMDDPSEYSGLTKIPFGEAGINEKGVSVSATVSTCFNKKVLQVDPLTPNGISEISLASYILQSAETARDGVKLLAECIDTYGHGNSDVGNPEYNEVSTVFIADRDETWLFEILSGHQYVATRLSNGTVSVLPNAIMTQQINVSDENIVASPGLIATAKAGGFYVTDTEGENEIHVGKSYGEGYSQYASYRYYYAAYVLNHDLADSIDIVPKPAAEVAELYPNASVEEEAIGPFCLEYNPSTERMGTIDLMTLREVFGSHGEGTDYITTSLNVNSEGEPMRAIGTYRQNEEHIFEIRKDGSLPISVNTIEWLAMAPSEFSVYIPFYAAAMTETPKAYTTETPDDFDPESIYWLFNEIGNTGNGHYYRQDSEGNYFDRYGYMIEPETAEAVLSYLSEKDFVEGLRSFMNTVQEDINLKVEEDDKAIIALAKTGTEEDVSAMANELAQEYADYILRVVSEKLADIDTIVGEYISSLKPSESVVPTQWRKAFGWFHWLPAGIGFMQAK